MKTTQELLGHSSYTTTMGICAQAIASGKREVQTTIAAFYTDAQAALMAPGNFANGLSFFSQVIDKNGRHE
ncbi:MAG: hypothetical protein M3R43_12595, partial [Acidobacteriota bacterium]|nr:hypothetical protein [Acidobacteriota bacterium]